MRAEALAMCVLICATALSLAGNNDEVMAVGVIACIASGVLVFMVNVKGE